MLGVLSPEGLVITLVAEQLVLIGTAVTGTPSWASFWLSAGRSERSLRVMATVPSGFFVTANAGEALVRANTPTLATPAMPSADPVNSAGRRKRRARRVAGLVAVTDDASAAVARGGGAHLLPALVDQL